MNEIPKVEIPTVEPPKVEPQKVEPPKVEPQKQEPLLQEAVQHKPFVIEDTVNPLDLKQETPINKEPEYEEPMYTAEEPEASQSLPAGSEDKLQSVLKLRS